MTKLNKLILCAVFGFGCIQQPAYAWSLVGALKAVGKIVGFKAAAPAPLKMASAVQSSPSILPVIIGLSLAALLFTAVIAMLSSSSSGKYFDEALVFELNDGTFGISSIDASINLLSIRTVGSIDLLEGEQLQEGDTSKDLETITKQRLSTKTFKRTKKLKKSTITVSEQALRSFLDKKS